MNAAPDAGRTSSAPRPWIPAAAARPPAADFFEAFPRSVKRSILEWISNAKKPETGAKRVEETARLAEQNIRANQQRQ